MVDSLKKMTSQEYIKDRLDDQIDWYCNKSTRNQKIYKRIGTAEIILAALIPVILIYDSGMCSKIIASLSGAMISVLTGIQRLGNFQENWLRYRMSCEILKREKVFFLSSTGPYSNNEESFKLFIERCEEVMNNENIGWREVCVSSSCKTQAGS